MANGNFGGGNGTIFNPYLVEDAHDLNVIRNYLGDTTVHFKQVSDIDLSSWGNWIPIQNGTSTSNSDVFRGVYDGGGFKIVNMMCQHDRDYVGLFGYTNYATIKNVFVESCNVGGNSNVGGLVGYSTSSRLSNCYSSGSVSGISIVGGLVGYSTSSGLSSCYSSGNVSGVDNIGGLVGYYISSTISNCYASGNVNGNDNVGGLVGYGSSSTISNCYSSGNVSGIDYIGGLVGKCVSSTISNCYASGNVSGNDNVGGLVGYISISPKILNCYALNSFISRVSNSFSSNFSDISNGSGTVENCFSLDTLEFRQL